jgi:phosphatidylserine/phosphatidylglycerophosphate/cardiolipin synthase-like enzyme
MAQKRKTVNRSTSSDLSRQQVRLRQTITTVLVLVALLLGAYYLLTGSDPLGLFSPEPTPTSLASISNIAAAGGDWWQVYFTDPHTINDPDNLAGSIPERLIGYINAAGQSIDVAAFEFDLTPVAEALVAAHERGVQVRWVTDDEYGIAADAEEGHGQFKMLTKAGIEVKEDGREALMHNKFWIFDSQIMWTGSTNVTVNGNFRNNNNVVVIDSPQVAAIFEREFDEMWSGEFGPRSPSTVDDQALTIDGTPLQVLFAPEDKVISRLTPLIEGAQSSLRFMAFSFTHDELGAVVLARAAADVDVKGIFETRGSETEYSELPALYCAGVPVRQDGNPGTFHHKIFVIDDKIVVTGSLNFSDNADESNDENVLVIANRDIAARYLQEFERRWAEATEPSPDDVKCK